MSPISSPSRERSSQTLASAIERRRQVRGLLLLALVVLLVSILRAGVHRVFSTGWYRLW